MVFQDADCSRQDSVSDHHAQIPTHPFLRCSWCSQCSKSKKLRVSAEYSPQTRNTLLKSSVFCGVPFKLSSRSQRVLNCAYDNQHRSRRSAYLREPVGAIQRWIRRKPLWAFCELNCQTRQVSSAANESKHPQQDAASSPPPQTRMRDCQAPQLPATPAATQRSRTRRSAV